VGDPSPIDPAAREVFSRFLAYGHPFWMVVTTGLLALALREGLSLRKARARGTGISSRARMLHVKVARVAVVALVLGAMAGPLSAVYLRGWSAFGTLHAWVASSVATLAIVTAVFGLRLYRGTGNRTALHGWLGLATVFGTAAAFLTGLVLLP
jgi:hypothetical protein